MLIDVCLTAEIWDYTRSSNGCASDIQEDVTMLDFAVLHARMLGLVDERNI